MSIKDLTQKSFSVLIIRSFGVLLLFGFTLFITNFYSAENVGRYDFVRSTLMVLGGISLMGTNQSIIYYSGLLNARKSIALYAKVAMTCPAVVLNHALQLFRDGGRPCGIPDTWPGNVLEPFPLTLR